MARIESVASLRRRGARSAYVAAAVALALALGPGVHAADAPTADALADQPASAGAPATSAEVPEKMPDIIITGSRIKRRDYESESPIVTLNSEAFQNTSSVDLETVMNQQPQFVVAGNQSALSSAQNPFPSATSTPGAATLNLRGLGANRTLVLVDGERWQPANAALVVDISSIPSAAIDSVETITGGAASTYGADAISGVVNFKLKKNFQGFQVDAQSGISQVGDDQEDQVSALMGGNFADDKGNAMLALTWARRGDVQGTNHGWVQSAYNDPTVPGGPPPLQEYYAPPGSPNLPPNSFLSPVSTGYYVDQNGSVFDANNPMNPAHPYTGPIGGSSGYKINPNGSLGWNNPQDPLQIPLNKWSAFASAHYTINDHVTVYAKADFSSTKTFYEAAEDTSSLESIWSTYIPFNNAWDNPTSPTFGQIAGKTQPGAVPGNTGIVMPFPVGPATFNPVPAQLANLLATRADPTAPWEYNSDLTYITGFQENNTSNIYQITLGFNGDLPWSWAKNWTWDVHGSNGSTNTDLQQPGGYANWSRLQQLFGSSNYGAGYVNNYGLAVSGSCTTGLPIFTKTGAVPVNAGPGALSADCANWITQSMNTVSKLTQQIGEGDIQGPLFDMPFGAGPVQLALGADYRSEDYSFNPDSGYNANQTFPEVVQNIILPVAVSGVTTVSEVYVEASIPLVKNVPFVKSLEFNPGYRFSDYNTNGGVNTFKLQGNWVVNDAVRFRGGLEVTNRAPNVAELFTPAGSSALAEAIDPCASYSITPTWANSASNKNRTNVQELCNYLMVKGGMPQSVANALMAPGSAAANSYDYNFNGPSPAPFPFALALTQGNPQLKPETARTLTFGTALRLPFDNPLVSKMSLSVDYYHIQLNNAIGSPSYAAVTQQCFDATYNSAMGSAAGSLSGAQLAAGNPLCGLITREYNPGDGDVYGAVRNYSAAYLNLGGIKTAGIDVQYDWTFRPSDIGSVFHYVPGAFSLNITGSYLQEFGESSFAGAPFIYYTGTDYADNNTTGTDSFFRYRLFTTLTYSVGPVSVGLNWQHLPGVDPAPGSALGILGAGAYNLYNLFAHWNVNDTVELRFGIDNLFDTWPKLVGQDPSAIAIDGNSAATNANYDVIGRRFYVGATAKF